MNGWVGGWSVGAGRGGYMDKDGWTEVELGFYRGSSRVGGAQLL